VEGESRTVRGGLSVTVVRIQHFSFCSKRGGDGMKRCQKMKRRQRAHLVGSMRMKCDTARQRDNVSRRRGGTGEGKGRRRRQLG
jgi:hypothetical protein